MPPRVDRSVAQESVELERRTDAIANLLLDRDRRREVRSVA